jgi:hypothetical protein
MNLSMTIQILEITLNGYDDKDERLMPLLKNRIFHSTSEVGYHGIAACGEVLSAKDHNIERQWPNAPSLFYGLGSISLWDFYHPSQKNIEDNIFKQTFYRHGQSLITYLLMLKEDMFHKVTTWYDLDPKIQPKFQIVPHIESGLPAPVPLKWFDQIIKINLWEDRPWHEGKEAELMALINNYNKS